MTGKILSSKKFQKELKSSENIVVSISYLEF